MKKSRVLILVKRVTGEKSEGLWTLMTPNQILEVALGKEEEAYRFYDRLLEECRADTVRELLERLKNEEYKHIRIVEEMITRLNLGKALV
jgi:rubrerythrin